MTLLFAEGGRLPLQTCSILDYHLPLKGFPTPGFLFIIIQGFFCLFFQKYEL